jgi:hypothetical protein
MTTADRPYAYVKFKQMKNICTKENQAGTPTAEDYYFRVDGTHNSIESLGRNEKRGHMIIGYGNLENVKYNEIRLYCDQRLGNGINPEIYRSVMDERVARAKDERKRQA